MVKLDIAAGLSVCIGLSQLTEKNTEANIESIGVDFVYRTVQGADLSM